MKILVPPDWRGAYRQAECGHRWPPTGELVGGLLYFRCTLCGYLKIKLPRRPSSPATRSAKPERP